MSFAAELPSSWLKRPFAMSYWAFIRAMNTKGIPEFPKEVELNNSPPTKDVQRMILFFKPAGRAPNNENIDFLNEEVEFTNKMRLYPWVTDAPHQETSDKEEQLNRSKYNVKSAIGIIKDGYKDMKPRRSGESKFIHSLRVFIRGTSELSHIGLSQLSPLYTSLLTRILHDAKEDLGEFVIKFRRTGRSTRAMSDKKFVGEYEVTFNEQTKPSNQFLYLTAEEFNLLQMQIDAVSVPSEVESMEDGNLKTEAQINHLLGKTAEIYKRHGGLAAYQTLRIKLDDRIDNLLTYYEMGNENSKEKYRAKLHETIIFFREVEEMAKRYFAKFSSDYEHSTGKDIPFPYSDTLESVVRFCYFLLYGGGYNEVLKNNIARSMEESKQNINFSQFLIPTLNPVLQREIGKPIVFS